MTLKLASAAPMIDTHIYTRSIRATELILPKQVETMFPRDFMMILSAILLSNLCFSIQGKNERKTVSVGRHELMDAAQALS
jgi:hypothetical protein